MGAQETGRLTALDGLRGWAALAVVIYHCLWQTFGLKFPELRTFPAAVAGNGILAVSVFLAISGYVLTIRRWHNRANPPLPYAVARRYLRLTLPIIAATLLVWLLMTLDQTPTRAAHRVTEIQSWYGTFVRFEPDIGSAWSFALLRAYWPMAEANYNPFLWTMAIELWGSLILFAVSQSDRLLREAYTPLLLCTALALALFPPAACFFAGAIIALAERDGFALPARPATSVVAGVAIVAALAAGALVQMTGNDLLTLALLAIVLFVGVRYSATAHKILNWRLSQVLGEISFPLYLVQFAVIVSFSAAAIVWANDTGNLNATMALAIAVASVAFSVAAAVLFLPVERGTLALLRRIDRARAAARPAAATAN